MGRSLPSSPKATWLTSDFPAGKAAGCFPQEKCPCLGPCPTRATLVPCPSTWAWPPASPPSMPPSSVPAHACPQPPLSQKDWAPSFSTPTTKMASPRHPAPCTPPGLQDEPRKSRASSHVLCTRPGREGSWSPHQDLALPSLVPVPRKEAAHGIFPHQDRARTRGLGALPALSSPCQAS